jgi:hypothetical protein
VVPSFYKLLPTTNRRPQQLRARLVDTITSSAPSNSARTYSFRARSIQLTSNDEDSRWSTPQNNQLAARVSQRRLHDRSHQHCHSQHCIPSRITIVTFVLPEQVRRALRTQSTQHWHYRKLQRFTRHLLQQLAAFHEPTQPFQQHMHSSVTVRVHQCKPAQRPCSEFTKICEQHDACSICHSLARPRRLQPPVECRVQQRATGGVTTASSAAQTLLRGHLVAVEPYIPRSPAQSNCRGKLDICHTSLAHPRHTTALHQADRVLAGSRAQFHQCSTRRVLHPWSLIRHIILQ